MRFSHKEFSLFEVKTKLDGNPDWVLIPNFQRGYVWKKNKEIIYLIDSVLNEIFINNFIIYQDRIEANKEESIMGLYYSHLTLEPILDSSFTENRKNYINGNKELNIFGVLDGQQRLTTLYNLLQYGMIFNGKKLVPFYINFSTLATLIKYKKIDGLHKFKGDEFDSPYYIDEGKNKDEERVLISDLKEDGILSTISYEKEKNYYLKFDLLFDMLLKSQESQINKEFERICDGIRFKSDDEDSLDNKTTNIKITNWLNKFLNGYKVHFFFYYNKKEEPILLEELLALFEKVNTGGKPLTKEEIFSSSLMYIDSNFVYKKKLQELSNSNKGILNLFNGEKIDTIFPVIAYLFVNQNQMLNHRQIGNKGFIFQSAEEAYKYLIVSKKSDIEKYIEIYNGILSFAEEEVSSQTEYVKEIQDVLNILFMNFKNLKFSMIETPRVWSIVYFFKKILPYIASTEKSHYSESFNEFLKKQLYNILFFYIPGRKRDLDKWSILVKETINSYFDKNEYDSNFEREEKKVSDFDFLSQLNLLLKDDKFAKYYGYAPNTIAKVYESSNILYEKSEVLAMTDFIYGRGNIKIIRSLLYGQKFESFNSENGNQVTLDTMEIDHFFPRDFLNLLDFDRDFINQNGNLIPLDKESNIRKSAYLIKFETLDSFKFPLKEIQILKTVYKLTFNEEELNKWEDFIDRFNDFYYGKSYRGVKSQEDKKRNFDEKFGKELDFIKEKIKLFINNRNIHYKF